MALKLVIDHLNMTKEESFAYTLTKDKSNEQPPLAQAYTHLQSIYPDAHTCDLSVVGVQ